MWAVHISSSKPINHVWKIETIAHWCASGNGTARLSMDANGDDKYLLHAGRGAKYCDQPWAELGLEVRGTRTWRARERESIMGVRDRSPQR